MRDQYGSYVGKRAQTLVKGMSRLRFFLHAAGLVGCCWLFWPLVRLDDQEINNTENNTEEDQSDEDTNGNEKRFLGCPH